MITALSPTAPPVLQQAVRPSSRPATATASPLSRGDRLDLSPTNAPRLQANGVPYLPAYRYTANNKVDLFYDAAEIYPQMQKLLSEAKQSIKMDYFIFSGKEAMKLAQIMVAKAKAGVKVEILLDPRLGDLKGIKAGEEQVINYLKANGIPVVFANYDALAPRIDAKEDVSGRLIDHNKIIIVDERAALIGGWNIADEFSKFHDGMVRIDGPAVADLVQQFTFDRHFAVHPEDARKGVKTPALQRADQVDSTPGLSTVRVNATGINRQNNQWALLERISRAQKSIYATLIELNDQSIIEALIVAKNRGVDVRLLMDANNFTNLVPELRKGPREWVSARAVKQLLDAGVDVHFWTSSATQDVVHAKMCVFDGEVLTLGSTDWHEKELRNTSDTSVEIHEGPAPEKAQRIFLNDWAKKSHPATNPAFYKRVLSKLYYMYS